MRNRITKVFAGLAALAALALGGAALASGQGSPQPARPAAPAQQQNGTEADTDSIQDENGQDDATEPAGEEQQDGAADTDSVQDENGTGDDTLPASPAADKAIAAALEAAGGGKANAVERDGEKGATYEVEVTKPDGSTVDVRLDGNYGVVSIDSDSEQEDSTG
ncbi:MAG: hypothetical protein MSC30_16720 [Gaiellaceae bacterium MAG52_C11]|nr:hypothetical protein [Candidatus Gaiellasilicea maunaloa]